MSTVVIFADKRLLTNIRRAERTMRVICNAESLVVTLICRFGGYGDVWYHPYAIDNKLSLQNVQKQCRVTFDSHNGNQFLVHRGDGTARVFVPTSKGLYVSQVRTQSGGVAMVNTIRENSESLTKREVKRACQAR